MVTTKGYARPHALIDTGWVAEHLEAPHIRLVEVDVDTSAYGTGHIPGAVGWDWTHDLQRRPERDIPTRSEWETLLQNIPWATAVAEDSTFLPAHELRAICGGTGITPDTTTIAYCRIGERSAHTWFVPRELLGYPDVRNYDGSWTEWGSVIGSPIAR